MAKRLETYKCPDCDYVVEVLSGDCGCESECVLKCCDSPLTLLTENTTDAAKEKHVPVVERVEGGYLVKVGSVAHPMTAEHQIVWIELIAGSKVYRQFLEPGEAPEAFFPITEPGAYAREYCNLHGLWRGE